VTVEFGGGEVAMRFDGAVMVGITGTGLDRIVLGWAAEEAAVRHADLIVCHVRNWWEPDRPYRPATEPAESAESLVRQAAGAVSTRFPDLEVTTAVGHDRVVVPALVRASLDARMVVVGARDGGLGGLRLSSVAEQVAAHARCPVAVVRPSSPDAVDVVAGLDGSAHSELTLRLAAVEARRFGGRLILVHGYRLPPLAEYGPNAGVDEPHHRAAAEGLLDGMVEQLGPDHSELKIETHVVHSSPAAAVLEAASGAAAVVIGARGRGGFGRLAIGSVGRQVLQHAPCPIVVAR
jgi:nucleotide-binding universal stress UspA family protein